MTAWLYNHPWLDPVLALLALFIALRVVVRVIDSFSDRRG